MLAGLALLLVVLHTCRKQQAGLLATSIALWGDGWVYEAVLAAQALWLVLAAAGKLKLRVPGAGLAWYYLLMTVATMAALVRYLREGAPLMWEKAEGTR